MPLPDIPGTDTALQIHQFGQLSRIDTLGQRVKLPEPALARQDDDIDVRVAPEPVRALSSGSKSSATITNRFNGTSRVARRSNSTVEVSRCEGAVGPETKGKSLSETAAGYSH